MASRPDVDGGTGIPSILHDRSSSNSSNDKVVGGVFRLIDKDGDGSLEKQEFFEWFEGSDLRGIMSFREFYGPIARLDSDGDGATDESEFVVAMEYFRR